MLGKCGTYQFIRFQPRLHMKGMVVDPLSTRSRFLTIWISRSPNSASKSFLNKIVKSALLSQGLTLVGPTTLGVKYSRDKSSDFDGLVDHLRRQSLRERTKQFVSDSKACVSCVIGTLLSLCRFRVSMTSFALCWVVKYSGGTHWVSCNSKVQTM